MAMPSHSPAPRWDGRGPGSAVHGASGLLNRPGQRPSRPVEAALAPNSPVAKAACAG